MGRWIEMYGETLGKIRKSKNYSQQTLAAGRFTQAAYSHFEKNKSDMNATNFVFLLDQLQLSLDELLYIHNDYALSPSEQLINLFYKIPYNKREDLEILLGQIELFLKENHHMYINELKTVCEALIMLTIDKDLIGAREKVRFIWERISKYDQYYLVDIKLLNAILFLFDFETMSFIAENLIQQLTRYKDLGEATRLQNTIILNYSILCIRNNEIQLAIHYLQPLLADKKQTLSYVSFAVALNRIAICLTYQNAENVAMHLKRRDMLLFAYNDDLLGKRLKVEFNTYRCNSYQIDLD